MERLLRILQIEIFGNPLQGWLIFLVVFSGSVLLLRKKRMDVQQEINLGIKEAFEKEGIKFA